MVPLKNRVLITDGDQRAALACTRSLGRAGMECLVLGPRKGNLAGASRFCSETLVAPDVMADPQGFRDLVLQSIRDRELDTLLPITEKSLRALLPLRGSLPEVNLPFPTAEVFERVSDKAEVIRKARDLGLAVPRQWEWHSRDSSETEVIPEDAFPVALKPPISVPTLNLGAGSRKVAYFSSPPDLEGWRGQASEADFPVLVQERIHGRGAGVFLLLWDQEVRAVVGHQRVREKPPSGGVSVVRESTVVDEGLLEDSLKLLKGLGWTHGVAMVEFKVREEDRVPFLMEINGRFWGSLQLAIDAGVDFPSILVNCGRNDPPRTLIVGKGGARTRWLLGDLDHLLLRLFRNRVELSLPPSAPGRTRVLLDFFTDFRPGTRLEVLKTSDPLPFLTELRSYFRDLL